MAILDLLPCLQVKLTRNSERSKEIAEITPTSATQGKTYENDNTYAATRVIDRDLSTRSIAQSSNGETWLKLKFDKTYYIDGVIVHYQFYTNWFDPQVFCVRNEANFRSCVNTDTNVDVLVYQGDVKQKSCGTLQLTYGLEQSDQIYTLICNTAGDTVKFSKSTGGISVCEVTVTNLGRKMLFII